MIKWKDICAPALAGVVGLSIAAGAAWAQDESATPTPDAEPEAATPSLDEQLSLGEAAEGDIGRPYTKEVVGDWEMRCIRQEEGEEEPCQMYQLLEDDQGAPVAEVSIFRLPDGGRADAGATVVVPLETALQQQLTITVDGGQARRYPFAFCNPVGCYSRIGLTTQDITAFKRGNVAQLTIVPVLAPDQKVTLDMSLNGFTAAYDKSSVIDQ